MLRTLRILLLGLLAWPVLAQQDAGPDPRMEKLLKKARLEYQYDASAGFKLINRFSSERLQAVFIESRRASCNVTSPRNPPEKLCGRQSPKTISESRIILLGVIPCSSAVR